MDPASKLLISEMAGFIGIGSPRPTGSDLGEGFGG